jgi:hypothetical protein
MTTNSCIIEVVVETTPIRTIEVDATVIPELNVSVCERGVQGIQGVQGMTGQQGVQGVQGAVTIVSYIFDGGSPSTNYSNGPAFNCGGVN